MKLEVTPSGSSIFLNVAPLQTAKVVAAATTFDAPGTGRSARKSASRHR